MPLLEIMTISKNLRAILLARTQHLNTKFRSNTCYLLLASGMKSLLAIIEQFCEEYCSVRIS